MAKQLFSQFVVSQLAHELRSSCASDVFCQLDIVLEDLLNVYDDDYWTPNELIRVIQSLQNTNFDICVNYHVLCIPTQFKTRAQVGLISNSNDEKMKTTWMSLDTNIMHNYATTQIIQKFATPDAEEPNQSTKFILPLPEGASVIGFEVSYQNTILIGEIEGKNDAQVKFNRAVRNGETAILLNDSEQTEYSKTFSMETGNLPGNTEIQISVTIFQSLILRERFPNDDTNQYLFEMPALLTPDFFVPKESTQLEKIPDRPTFSHTIHISSDTDNQPRKIESPSHYEILELQEGRGVAVYETKDEKYQKRDFLLLLEYQRRQDFDYSVSVENNPLLELCAQDQGSAVELQLPVVFDLPPDYSLPDSKKLAIVMDTSSSMNQVLPLLQENVHLLLTQIIESFPSVSVDFTFCLLSTESSCWHLGALSDNVITDIERFFMKQISFGGSRFSSLLEALEDMEYHDIILFTDGKYNDDFSDGGAPDKVISNQNRFFPILLGYELDSSQIEDITRTSGGRLERTTPFVEYNKSSKKNLISAYTRQLHAVFDIIVDKVNISWFIHSLSSQKLQQLQQSIEKQQNLFSGDILTLSRIFDPISDKDLYEIGDHLLVSITGLSQGQTIFNRNIPIDLTRIQLHGRCTVGKYGPLCIEEANQTTLRRSLAQKILQQFAADSNGYYNQLESLALQYSLASPYTSFVSITGKQIDPNKTPRDSYNNAESSGSSLRSTTYVLGFVLVVLAVSLQLFLA